MYKVSVIFCLNAFLVSGCTKGYLPICFADRGKGNRTPGMYAEIFVSRILQLFGF